MKRQALVTGDVGVGAHVLVAGIGDPHVETPDGRRVNALVFGDRYVYTYGVEFAEPVSGAPRTTAF